MFCFILLTLDLGVDKATAYAEKFGVERAAMIRERLSQTGKDAGINFKFGGKTGKCDHHVKIH